jgi:hypothetical protein
LQQCQAASSAAFLEAVASFDGIFFDGSSAQLVAAWFKNKLLLGSVFIMMPDQGKALEHCACCLFGLVFLFAPEFHGERLTMHHTDYTACI